MTDGVDELARSLREYTYQGRKSVDGWFDFVDSAILMRVLICQRSESIQGSVAETGVHHGKSFIPLGLSLHADEKGHCIDLFEQQELNHDQSGHGDLVGFRGNLKFLKISERLVSINQGSFDL